MKLIVVYIFSIFLFRSKGKGLHHVAILILSALFSMRGITVPDTEPYMDIYKAGSNYIGIEQGFLWLCDYFNSWGASFPVFVFFLSIVMLEMWYYCSCKIFGKNSVGVMAIMMLSYFGFYFYGIVLRSAIAITLCYFGITILFSVKRKLLAFFLYYLIVFSP